MRYRSPITLATALKSTRFLLKAGASTTVEIGAIEPLLWRDGSHRIADLVESLCNEGVCVSLTTNGSRLHNEALALSRTGLDHINISWHTTDKDIFREITGGGDYGLFLAGLLMASRMGLRVSVNRVLLRGIEHDLESQLDFVQAHDLKIKLYDLLWTPILEPIYQRFYIDWREIVQKHVLPRTKRVVHLPSAIGRSRIRYDLRDQGTVEVKVSPKNDRSLSPCKTCEASEFCLEAFGDYLRVMPDGSLRFCYLRPDLSLPMHDRAGAMCPGSWLSGEINKLTAGRAGPLIAGAKIRLIVTPYCNFNCRIPGTNVRFCHKDPDEFVFPARPNEGATENEITMCKGGGSV